MHSTDPRRISVVIPTLNEAENIQELVARILAATKEVEIIVVDDNSRDGTQEKVLALQNEHPVILLERKKPEHGLTGAVLAGARAASCDVVVVMDADLSHPPERILDLAAPVLEQKNDMVIGSRYAPGGSTPGWPAIRRWMSRAASALAWPLTDVHDALGGFFAVRRELLTEIPPDAAGFKIALEVLVRGGDSLRVSEVPITFVDRAYGQSKMGSKVIFTYLQRLFVLAGGRHSHGGVGKILGKSISVWLLDFLAFVTLLGKGVSFANAQLASFSIAGVLSYFFFRRQNNRVDSSGARLGFIGRVLLVFFIALILRAGFMGTLITYLGWNPLLAIVPAMALGGAVKYLGSCFYIWPIRDQHGSGIRWRIVSVGVFCFGFLLRLFYVGQTELFPEESYYWAYSRHLALGYLDHPPMIAWLIRAGTAIFGQNPLGARVPIIFCSLAAAVFVYKLTNSFYGKSAAFRSLLLMAILPIFFATGTMATPDAPLVACWAGLLYFLQRALLQNSTRSWVGVGLLLGLGLLSKYTIAIVGLAALIFMVLDAPSRRWFLHPAPYLSVLFSLAIFSPVITWNAQHQWASFTFQSTRRLSARSKFSTHVLVASILGLLTPTGLLAGFQALLSPPKDGTQRRNLFIRVFTLVPLCVFVFFSIRHRPQFNWTGPLWLALVPTIAALLPQQSPARSLNSTLRALWNPTIVTLLIATGTLFYHLAFGLPGLGYSKKIELLPVGWLQMAREIQKVVQEHPGEKPLVVGMDKYFIASQLAFHSPDPLRGIRQVTNRHFFGARGLMYAYWFNPNTYKGRSLVAVSFNRDDLSKRRLGKFFDSLGPIIEGRLEKNGRPISSYFYRIGSGYRGVSEESSRP